MGNACREQEKEPNKVSFPFIASGTIADRQEMKEMKEIKEMGLRTSVLMARKIICTLPGVPFLCNCRVHTYPTHSLAMRVCHDLATQYYITLSKDSMDHEGHKKAERTIS